MTDPLDFKRTVDRAGEKDRQRAGLRAGSYLGKYHIIRLLGRGGMGEVYEVEHMTLKKKYALKLIPEELVSQRGFLERFQREAHVMAILEHPGIVKVDDFGEDDGHYWLRMELLEGIEKEGKRIITLTDLGEAGGGRVEPGLLAGILTQILDSLAYAHRKGLVHRDLKPANILLSGKDISSVKVKIADFGLVRLIGEEWVLSRVERSISSGMSLGDMKTEGEDNKSGTSTRSLLGTYEYMSPEQKRGEEADVRSDLYAVGLIAFRLLTGERELSFKLPSKINKDISPVWDELIIKSVESHKEERFASAEEMLESLQMVRIETIGEAEEERTPEEAYKKEREKIVSGEALTLKISQEVEMEFISIPPGKFTRGSPPSEKNRDTDEGPLHQIKIAWEFYLGRYPVTQEQYEVVMGSNPGRFKGAKNPVENVSWHEAVEFCQKLGQKTGKEFRLPTEAEWEYACRAGTTTTFHYGDSLSSNEANFDGRGPYGNAEEGVYRKKTTPVGSFPPNAFGIYDMHGNVWEWCSDWYDKHYYHKSPAVDPKGPASGESRLLRGGSWSYFARLCRSANRYSLNPDRKNSSIGFRVVLIPSESPPLAPVETTWQKKQFKKIKCSNCNREVLFDPNTQLNVCNLCGSSLDIEQAKDIEVAKPDCIIPFKTTKQQVNEALLEWLIQGDYTPADILIHSALKNFSGIYLPFYLFEGDYSANWSASSGYDREETYTDYEYSLISKEKEPITRTKTVIDWRPSSGQVSGSFSVLVIASGLPLKKLASFCESTQWPEKTIQNFDERHIKGFTLKPFSSSSDECYEKGGKSKVVAIIRSHVNRVIPGDHQRDVSYDPSIQKDAITLYLPFWMVTYSYSDKKYQCIIDGQRVDRIEGDRPVDEDMKGKISAFFLPLKIVSALYAVATILPVFVEEIGFTPVHRHIALLGLIPVALCAIIGTVKKGNLLREQKQLRQESLQRLKSGQGRLEEGILNSESPPLAPVETIMETKEEREPLSLKIPLQKLRLSWKMWLALGGIFFILLLLFFRPPPPPFPRRAYLIQSPLAELLSRPGKEGERVGSLLVGSEVKIISETNGWYRVRSPKGEGYLTKGSLGEKPPIFGFKDRMGRAHYYYRAANYSQALEELSEAITLKPQASEPYMLSTLIYLAQGEKENAFKEFQEALKRGIVGEHPLIVKIKTRHAILKAEPQKVKSIDGNIIELKDGSIFHGEIILERR